MFISYLDPGGILFQQVMNVDKVSSSRDDLPR